MARLVNGSRLISGGMQVQILPGGPDMNALIFFLISIFSASATGIEFHDAVLPSTIAEIKQAEKSFNLPLKIWLGFLPGNDGQDPLHKAHRRSTVIFHHDEPSAKKHYIIYWFHGMGGYHKFGDNMFPQMKELIRRQKSFTIIEPEMPWSCNVSRIDGRQSWSKLGSFRIFAEAAKKKISIPAGKEIVTVVGGHSRGGKGIRDALVSGGLCDMNPDWILWSDATYSTWFDKSWNACLKNIAYNVEIFYLKGTETGSFVRRWDNDQHFPFVHLKPLSLPWYHGKIGNNALILSEFLK